jgi:hypothetical protein
MKDDGSLNLSYLARTDCQASLPLRTHDDNLRLRIHHLEDLGALQLLFADKSNRIRSQQSNQVDPALLRIPSR